MMDRKTSTGRQASLDQIKALAGDWEGKDEQGNVERVTFRVTSGGTAVQETLFPGTPHEMVDVYHMDAGNLVMTHYCMLGNQPYLKAEALSPTVLDFNFAGGSNVKTNEPHMHELRLTLRSSDEIRQEWVGYDNGKPNETKIIDLKRKS